MLKESYLVFLHWKLKAEVHKHRETGLQHEALDSPSYHTGGPISTKYKAI